MNRDNLLYALVGLLAGFVVGYLTHEALSARQALPATAAPGVMGSGGAPGMAPPGMPPGTGGGSGMDDVSLLRAYVEENPDDAGAVLQLGNMNYDIQSWSRARELYLRYLELRPEDPDVLTDLGVAQRGAGELSQALESFDRAQELAPEHWQSLFNKVVLLTFDLRDLDAAHDALAKLRALQPTNPEVDRLAQVVARAAN